MSNISSAHDIVLSLYIKFANIIQIKTPSILKHTVKICHSNRTTISYHINTVRRENYNRSLFNADGRIFTAEDSRFSLLNYFFSLRPHPTENTGLSQGYIAEETNSFYYKAQ